MTKKKSSAKYWYVVKCVTKLKKWEQIYIGKACEHTGFSQAVSQVLCEAFYFTGSPSVPPFPTLTLGLLLKQLDYRFQLPCLCCASVYNCLAVYSVMREEKGLQLYITSYLIYLLCAFKYCFLTGHCTVYTWLPESHRDPDCCLPPTAAPLNGGGEIDSWELW